MSMSALLRSVRNVLQEQIPFTEAECRIMPGPAAYPVAPVTFCAIYGSLWASDEVQKGLLESFAIACTVTKRIRAHAGDLLGSEVYTKEFVGLEQVCRNITAVLQFNHSDIVVAANAIIGSDVPQFVGVLEWQGTDALPDLVGPEWFSEELDTKNPAAGMVMTSRFGGILRLHATVDGDLTNIVV